MLLPLLVSLAGAPDPTLADRVKAFDYDAKAPLNPREEHAETIGGVAVSGISYDSPRGGRVPGYLVTPPGKGRFAGIVFMHWGQGDRTEFLSEALEYAHAGAVSLMIDAPYNRPEFKTETGIDNPQGERALYEQLVVDLRRAFDLLVSRSDIDPARLAYVGHSLGATWGGALAGVDRRARVYVLMGGLPSLTDPSHSYTPEFWNLFVGRHDESKIRAYQATLGPIDPEHFVGHAAPSRVVFQFARKDRYISDAAASAYAAAASDPKDVRSYFTSHEFNDLESLRDRADILRRELGLGPVYTRLGGR